MGRRMSIGDFERIESNNLYLFNSFVTEIENSSFHWHYEYELIYVIKGSILVYTNPVPVHMRERDILLVNAKTVHAIRHTEEKNNCMILQLNPHLFQIEPNLNLTYRFSLNSAHSIVPADWDREAFVKTICRLALLFLENKRKNYYRLRALAYQIVADLFDFVLYDVNYKSRTRHDDSDVLMEIIEYMETHLQIDDIIDRICVDLGMSNKTLYRFLKDNLGLSIKELVDNLRIDKAKHYLKFSNKSMDYIASQCGLGSESSFYRIFKNKTGLTPSRYRIADLPLDKNPQVQGYVNFRSGEAISLLKSVLEA